MEVGETEVVQKSDHHLENRHGVEYQRVDCHVAGCQVAKEVDQAEELYDVHMVDDAAEVRQTEEVEC